MSSILRHLRFSWIVIAVLFLPALVQAQTLQYSYLYVEPATEGDPLTPYVIQLAQSSDSTGFIFLKDVRVTLFTEAMTPMEIEVYPLIHHVQSGGYRLVDNRIWSGTTIQQDEYNRDQVSTDAFARVRDTVAVQGLYGNRPTSVRGQVELLIVGRNTFTPQSATQPYESCGQTEDVKGVTLIDFAADSPNFPTFQVVQLGTQPVRFGVPSFNEARGFVAVGNNVGVNGQGLDITRIDAAGNRRGTVILLNRETLADYALLYRTLNKAGAEIVPLVIQQDAYDPQQFMEIQTQGLPACRGFAQAVEVVPIEGIQEGINYYLPGGTEALGRLAQDNVVAIQSISPDGRVCFIQPGGAETLVCANGWLLKRTL